MKKIILIILSAMMISNTFGQVINSNLVTTPEMFNVNNFTNRFNTVQDNGLPMVLNVKFHGIHETDGSDLHSINEERFLKIIATLNINFNQFNIFFKYRGYNIINNSAFVNNYFSDWVNYTTLQGNFDENAINIMINNDSGFGTGAGSNAIKMTTQLSDANTINGFSPFYDSETNFLLGFTLGLFPIDTRAYLNSTLVTNNLPSCITSPFIYKAYFVTNPGFTLPENVTRDNSNFNYNADTAGDMVADTQACFDGFTQNYCNDNGNIYQIFIQHPEVVDFTGTMYNCTASESHNFMLYGNYGGIPNSFTAGQGARMRQFIISNPNNFNPSLNLLDDGSPDVQPLFEPYSAHIISGNIVSTEDLGDGTANICRSWLMEHKFQPGFTYNFPDNVSPDSIDVPATLTDIPLVTLNTFDYPVTIAQLDPALTNLTTNTGVAHISCTRGLNCTIENYISGKILQQLQLFSPNYTVEELNAMQVKDPDLFNKLLSNYYYKIEKETESGAKTSEVFFKP